MIVVAPVVALVDFVVVSVLVVALVAVAVAAVVVVGGALDSFVDADGGCVVVLMNLMGTMLRMNLEMMCLMGKYSMGLYLLNPIG